MHESRFRELEWELYRARSLILHNLIPPQMSAILTDHHEITSLEAMSEWYHDAVERIIAQVHEPEDEDGDDWEDGPDLHAFHVEQRIPCPLCRQSNRSFYPQGFSLPEGLRRHLHGSHNSRHCPVMEQVMGLVRDRVLRAEASPGRQVTG
jgi:hypothetical protein